MALEKLFICAVAAELVHGLEKEISARVQRRSKLRAVFGVGLERDCQRQVRVANSSGLVEIFHLGICWGALMKSTLRKITSRALTATLTRDVADALTSVSQG